MKEYTANVVGLKLCNNDFWDFTLGGEEEEEEEVTLRMCGIEKLKRLLPGRDSCVRVL